jgi:hypothetical protein
MAGNKTIANEDSVADFIAGLDDAGRRQDSSALIALMRHITDHPPKMWGGGMIGFGSYRYRYASGREGEFFLTGFATRKSALTLYIMPGFARYGDLLEKLGPHRLGKSCLYLKNLDSVDHGVLEELIRDAVARMREKYRAG